MLLLIIILILLAGVIEWQSLKDRLDFVSYSSWMTKSLIEPGEQFEIVSTVENTGRLPISFIEITERLPYGVEIDMEGLKSRYSKYESQVYSKGEIRLLSSFYLWPRQRIERSVPVSLKRRGRYLLRGATLSGGDFFGLSKTSRNFDLLSEIIVMPESSENEIDIKALGGFLGDMSVRRFIMEDPVLTLGFRDYSGMEPQKSISWKQSARLGRMMVKQYDYTLEPSVTIVLNVQCGDGNADEELIERCFSLSRTVCETLEKKRIKYGFITNATTAGALGIWSTVTEGLGGVHISAILEGLGRATYEYTERFELTIERAVRLSENGRSHIIITPFEYESLQTSLKRLRDITGGDLLLLAARS